MQRNLHEERITISHTMAKSLKAELRDFSHFSRETESATIENALIAYFKSSEGYQKIVEAEQAKREFFQSLEEGLGKPIVFSPNSVI